VVGRPTGHDVSESPLEVDNEILSDRKDTTTDLTSDVNMAGKAKVRLASTQLLSVFSASSVLQDHHRQDDFYCADRVLLHHTAAETGSEVIRRQV
jgi:hypothetical protein